MEQPPVTKGFIPVSGAAKKPAIRLLLEEYEAIRLADYNGYSQVDAAAKMDVSRPTFTRIYDRALKKTAQAFVENREILFVGGHVTFDQQWLVCHACNFSFKIPGQEYPSQVCPVCGSHDVSFLQEEGRPKTVEATIDFHCECPSCGRVEPHQQGVPCREMTCPDCGQQMRRKTKNY